MRLINADKLESEMYHNAFEIDTDLQKWDSGCWIRYKMFENVIEEQPTVKAIPIEWIKSKKIEYEHDRYDYVRGCFDGFNDCIDYLIDEWEKENEKSKTNRC